MNPFRYCLVGALLCIASNAFCIEPAQSVVNQLQRQALADNTAWEVVESLTTEVGPRMGGTAGDARAVAWAQNKLTALGFDRVWIEPVKFPTWRRGKETARVIVPFVQDLSVTALGSSRSTPPEGLQSEIVHFRTFADLQEARSDLVRDKIVFISHRMERFRDGRGYGEAVVARSRGAETAAEKGAVGLLIRSIGTDSDRLPHTGMMRYKVDARRIPAAALSNPDADLLLRMLKYQEPVVVNLLLGSDLAEEYTSHNVIAEVTGSQFPEQVILIGAHLDSWDLGQGAIDDGAGVAIVTAAAKLISGLPQRPARTIRVVLYANEEQGLFGAKAYRDAHKDELNKHIIGGESDFGAGRIYRFSTNALPAAKTVIAQIAEYLKPLGIAWDQERKASGGPDVGRMGDIGMAVFDLSQDGTDYFDYHHTANDTLDKIDPGALKQNVAAWATVLYMVAQSSVRFGPVPVTGD